MSDTIPTPNEDEFIFYTAVNGTVKVSVVIRNETIWLTQQRIANLFDRDRSVISKHFKNIFDSGELEEKEVCAKFAHTAADGKTYQTNYYNLDAIISVGYRVNSYQATQFRIWATQILKEYIIKGFAMDDERLKQGGQLFGRDYFDELLERIREIRASERRFYQKITDIYAQCSIDYDSKSPLSKTFYATAQNKLHWAITGKTAAEIIYSSADAEKAYMGLTNWKNAPDGKILKSDIKVAKNYLDEQHISVLNRLVSVYLDLAEDRAERQIPMHMADWITFLDRFLALSDYPILSDSGRVSALDAKLKAAQEYDKFREVQDEAYLSDFDRQIKHLTSGKKDDSAD